MTTIATILAGRNAPVLSVSRADTVQAAATLLAHNRIGAVPVLDEGALVGIFSERDIVRLLDSHGVTALALSLAEVMTRSPVTCDSSTAVMGALSLMTQRRVRHLPIVDGEKLIGFVSIGDLVKHRLDRIESEAAAMRAYIAS